MKQPKWARVIMNQKIQKAADHIFAGYSKLDMLEVSGTRWRLEGNEVTYESVNFPEFDICEQKLSKTFDFIVAEQVFEHLLYPARAARNIYQMLKENGWFLISVPFSYPLHNYPIDCTRWSEIGLKHFLADNGWELKKIHVESWGNRDCAKAHLDGSSIPYDNHKHNLTNEPDCPVMVWAFAQK